MAKQPNMLVKIIAFAVLVLFLVGCASASTPSLLGTWVTNVTETEAPLFAGQWELTFADNGRCSMLKVGNRFPDDGRCTITPDQFVVTDEGGGCATVGFPTATYKWSVENDVLTMAPIGDDGCYNRRKIAEGRKWSRKK